MLPFRAKPWEGTFQAVHTFKNCPQIHEVSLMCDEMLPSKNELNFDPIAREEDCLKLNIFTPECDDKAKLPVSDLQRTFDVMRRRWTMKLKRIKQYAYQCREIILHFGEYHLKFLNNGIKLPWKLTGDGLFHWWTLSAACWWQNKWLSSGWNE